MYNNYNNQGSNINPNTQNNLRPSNPQMRGPFPNNNNNMGVKIPNNNPMPNRGISQGFANVPPNQPGNTGMPVNNNRAMNSNMPVNNNRAMNPNMPVNNVRNTNPNMQNPNMPVNNVRNTNPNMPNPNMPANNVRNTNPNMPVNQQGRLVDYRINMNGFSKNDYKTNFYSEEMKGNMNNIDTNRDDYEDADYVDYQDNYDDYYDDRSFISRHKVSFAIIFTLSILILAGGACAFLYYTHRVTVFDNTPVAKVLDTCSNKFSSIISIDDEEVPVSDALINNIKTAPVDDTNEPEPNHHVDKDTNASGSAVAVSDIKKSVQPYEQSGVTIGIDVSKWQGTIDWTSVAASGIDYAMIRIGYRTATTGEIFEDPFARYNLQKAQAAGVKIGAYFFSTAITEQEAAQEAAFTCKIISQYKITYPVAFDYEKYDDSSSRNFNLSASTKTNIAMKFLKYVSKQGYSGMFYSSKSGLENDFETNVIADKYKIWVANYPAQTYPAVQAPEYTGSYDMWQYTAMGAVTGISGALDVNVAKFGFSQETAPKNATVPTEVVLDPEVGIAFEDVHDTVTAKIEVNLREKPSALDESTIVVLLKNGKSVTRTGIGSNGWSRLIYNNKTVYAVTSFLTTDLNDTSQVDAEKTGPDEQGFTAVNEKVSPKDSVNLRSSMDSSKKDNIVKTVKAGTSLTRTGVNSNGWSKLTYNGKTVYAISGYLNKAK